MPCARVGRHLAALVFDRGGVFLRYRLARSERDVSTAAPPPDRPAQSVAVIGLGNLGGAVAAHFADVGYRTFGYDLSEAARDRATAAGVAVRSSLAESVATADVVITSLPDGAAVKSAWDELTECARPGTYLIELSTIGPDTMLEVAAPAERAGLKVIDAPVSGGPMEAIKGQLVVIVGGAAEDIAAVDGVLHDIGWTVHLAGPVGSAKTVKLVNNLITNATVLVSAEAFQIGVAAGIEPRHLFDLLCRWVAASRTTSRRGSRGCSRATTTRGSASNWPKGLPARHRTR